MNLFHGNFSPVMLFAASFSILIGLQSVVAIEWTDKELDKMDENGPEINRLFLIYANWCGACRRYKPKLDHVSPNLLKSVPNLEIIRVNLDNAPLLGSRLRVSHLPSLYHQLGGDFRKVGAYQDKLENYFQEKLWTKTPLMGRLSPPRGKGAPQAKNDSPFSFEKFIKEDLNTTVPVFLLLAGVCGFLIAMVVIWFIWLYTDYKLNAHNFTEEGVRKRIKELRNHPDFKDQFDDFDTSKEDSGEESDSESGSENKLDGDAEPLIRRGRRASIKNQLK
jgi:thiol-disulfide isomerase/thioredoxin